MKDLRDAIIVMPTDTPWNWSTDYVNQTADFLRKKNTVICFIKGQSIPFRLLFFRIFSQKIFKKYAKNLYHYTYVYFLPFRRFRAIESANFYLNLFVFKSILWLFYRKRQYVKSVLWIFHPVFAPFLSLFGPSYYSIYDCVDFFSGDTLPPKEKNQVESDNALLLRHANLACVNSRSLYSRFQLLRSDISIVPQGFRYESFKRKSRILVHIPSNKPVIGYVGAFNYRLDFDLLESLIKRNSQWFFVFVGKFINDIEGERTKHRLKLLFDYPNVMMISSVEKRYIPGIIKQFDVAIIPYDMSIEFNRLCYPMKLLEYFYMGKPVISTDIRELEQFPKFVKIGKTASEWEYHIRALLTKPWPKKNQYEERQLALANSWNMKLKRIITLIRSI